MTSTSATATPAASGSRESAATGSGVAAEGTECLGVRAGIGTVVDHADDASAAQSDGHATTPVRLVVD